jgi:hypothetical protein
LKDEKVGRPNFSVDAVLTTNKFKAILFKNNPTMTVAKARQSIRRKDYDYYTELDEPTDEEEDERLRLFIQKERRDYQLRIKRIKQASDELGNLLFNPDSHHEVVTEDGVVILKELQELLNLTLDDIG